MKDFKNIIILAFVALLSSCMADKDSFDAPDLSVSPYGNNSITETNVISIADLKTKFSTVIMNNGMKLIDDGTSAFIICIAQGGIYGYLPVGQEILVDLKGLYIGAYGQQGEIGTPYTSASGSTYVSRMSRFIWNEHFKLLGKVEPSSVTPIEFDKNLLTNANYIAANCGRLMTIRDVELQAADGKAVFAPDDGSVPLTANCANRNFKDISSSALVLRTSTYADFAGNVMPTGKVNVTGIFTRYRNTWQILLRTIDDIQPAP